MSDSLEGTKGGIAMATDRVKQDELLSDEELISRADADPQRRAEREALAARVASGELRPGPGVENLSEFLRGIRERMGH